MKTKITLKITLTALLLILAMSLSACAGPAPQQASPSQQSAPVSSGNAQQPSSPPSSPPSSAGSSETLGEVIELVDVKDRAVTIQGPVERAYLGFYHENLLAIAGPDVFTKVVATSRYDTDGYFAALTRLYSEHVPGYAEMEDIGSTFQDSFNIERLLEMNLDVVILGAYQYNALAEDIPLIEATGTPVVVIDYYAGTIELQSRSSEILGKVFGAQERAKQVIDDYQAAYADIARRLSGVEEAGKKRLILEFHSGISKFTEIGASSTTDDFGAEYINRSGGVNVMLDDAALNIQARQASPEYILEADPEYVFIIGGETTNPDKEIAWMGHGVTETQLLASVQNMIPSRPGWETLTAVKNNNIFIIDSSVCRTMDDYAVVQFMAKAMYPELFEDIDPMKSKQDFYAKYIPDVPLSGTFLYRYEYEG